MSHRFGLDETMQGYEQSGGLSRYKNDQLMRNLAPTTPTSGVQQQYSNQRMGTQPAQQPPIYVYQQPPPKKGKWWIISGILILIIGIILSIISMAGYIDDSTAIEISELADDYDTATNSFSSYDVGDEIKVKGRITDKEEIEDEILGEGLGYAYYLDYDDTILILSEDDIGDYGDSVYINCEVRKLTRLDEREYLEVQSSLQEGTGLVCLIASVIVLIIGLVLLIIGYILKKKKTNYPYPPPVAEPIKPPPFKSNPPRYPPR